MAIIYRIEKRKDYLYLAGEGTEVDLDDNQQIHQMIVNLCKEHDCQRVLVDDRVVTYTASISSIFYLVKYYAEVDIPRHIKRAAVVANSIYKETNSFFETTAYNRGINLRVFYNHEEAEAWLLE